MRLQWHPPAGRRRVRSFEAGPRAARAASAILAALACLWLALPLALGSVLERWRRGAAEADVVSLNARRKEALALATSALRQTRDRLGADRQLLARIAWSYGLEAVFSRVADSRPSEAGDSLTGGERDVATFSSAVEAIEDFEREHPEVPARTPSISPVAEATSVTTRTFGWGLSALTGKSEYAAGIELAVPAGSRVAATAEGVVRWAGVIAGRGAESYRRFGRIVAVKHGEGAITIYGNLASIAVRRGQAVSRGTALGTAGVSPWLGAPRVRYEVWRRASGGFAPADPRLAMLDDRDPAALDALRGRRDGKGRAAEAPALPSEFR